MDAAAPVHSFAQRWRDRREYRRPAAERIDPAQFGVEILRDSDAKAFVTGHHYSGSYPAARLAVGVLAPAVAVIESEKGSADLGKVLKEVDERVPAHL